MPELPAAVDKADRIGRAFFTSLRMYTYHRFGERECVDEVAEFCRKS